MLKFSRSLYLSVGMSSEVRISERSNHVPKSNPISASGGSNKMLKTFKNVQFHLENILELSHNELTSRTSDFADGNTTIGDNCRRCVFV